jgi:hypothetical protein
MVVWSSYKVTANVFVTNATSVHHVLPNGGIEMRHIGIMPMVLNMVKTRISSIPELVKHLDIQIDGVTRSLDNFDDAFHANADRIVIELKSELRTLKDIRAMLIC